MAKQSKFKKDSDRLKKSFLEQAEELWETCFPKFFEALEESESKKIKLSFGASLNVKERENVVDVDLAFKDKTTESGLDVVKTFHASKRSKLPDPDQPDLPGTEGKKDGKKPKGGGDGAPQE